MSASSIAAISNQACPSECLDGDMSTAEERSTKRARIEIKPFTELDISEFTLKDKGKGKNGGHMAYPLLAGETIRFNLTPNEWLRTPFGFDVDSKFDKPSFLGGKVPDRADASEGLSLRLDLASAQEEFLTKLDNATQEAFGEIAADAKWSSAVTTNPVFKSALCKVLVVLKGADLTKLAIVVDGKVVRGEGWQFLEPFVKRCNGFKFADVKITVRVKKLWNVAGRAGIGLEATQLVLKPSERPTEEDAFADDAELLA